LPSNGKLNTWKRRLRGIFRKNISAHFLNKCFSEIPKYATKMDAHQI
jgi:hypothetical protein